MTPTRPTSGLEQRIHAWAAPLVVAVASSLAVVSVPAQADLPHTFVDLLVTDDRFVGWAGVALIVCVGGVAATLALAAGRMGPAIPLAVGAAASVCALGIGRSVTVAGQLELTLVLAGAAVAGLLAGGATAAFSLPTPQRYLTVAAWAVPLVVGWPLQAWFALHTPVGEDSRVLLAPPGWLVVAASLLLAVWGALDIWVVPARLRDPAAAGFETAWPALLGVVGLGGLAAMILGFTPELASSWRRPLVVLLVGLLVVCLAAVVRLLPSATARLCYPPALLAGALVPACLSSLVAVADGGVVRISPAVMALPGLALVLGAILGLAWAGRWVRWGPLAVAVSAAGTWAMPGTEGYLLLGFLPLVAAATVTLVSALVLSLETPATYRFVVLGTVGSLALGLVIATPLGWALTEQLSTDVDHLRAVGRVQLGLLFAAGVAVAAYASIQRPEGSFDRRAASEGDPSEAARDAESPGRTRRDVGSRGAAAAD